MTFKFIPGVSIKILVILSAVLVIACGKKKGDQEAASQEYDQASEQLKEQVEEVIYEIPQPSEIPYIIESTGADFSPNIVNDITKYETYISTPQRGAFNMGVYASDIGYLSSYSKTQDALNYMDGILKMVEGMGYGDAIDVNLLESFENNLNDKDSLAKIIDHAMSKSDEYLKANDRANIAALAVGGSFVEGLYISTQIVDTYPRDILADDQRMTILAPMIKMILDQKQALGNLIKLLDSVQDKDEWVNGTIQNLNQLYENMDQFDAQGKIAEGKANEVLNDDRLSQITAQVASIRNGVVN